MAINPAIALGVQPSQPLDMLGAYGKAMSIKNLVDGAKLQQLQSESLGQKMRFDQQDQAFDLAKKKIGLFQQGASGLLALPPEQRAAQYPMFRQEAMQLTGETNIPEQYDEGYVSRLAMSGMDPKASFEAAQAMAQRMRLLGLQQGVIGQGGAPAAPAAQGSGDVAMNEDGTASLTAPPISVRGLVNPATQSESYGTLLRQIMRDPILAGTPIEQNVRDAYLKMKVEEETSPGRGVELRARQDGSVQRFRYGEQDGAPMPMGRDPNAEFWMAEDGVTPIPNTALQAAKDKRAELSGTKVSFNTKEQDESAKVIGKGYGEQYTQIQQSEFASRKRIGRAERLENLLEGVQTGKLTPLGTQLAGYAHALGFEIDPKLGNKEAAIALESEMALELRNPAGGAGMPGAMSDADRNFLQNMASFSNKTPQGRKLMLESYRAIAKRDADIAKLARDYKKRNNGKFDEGFYDEIAIWSAQNPMFPSATIIEAEKARRGLK